jgi:glycosyltransferase involved in cell wall biosynthesis
MPGEREPQDIERIISARLDKLKSKLTLFCSGVNWYRKGIDVAVKVVERLNASGINTELLVAGCSPPKGESIPEYVHLLGFISKAQPQGVVHLARLYETSHWFILPTRADCSPIVFCEAASYGLPSIASRTGGVESLVREGVSGWPCDPASTPQQWADRISAIVRNPTVYANLCRTTYAEYKKRLNWTTSGATIKKVLEELLAKRNFPSQEDRAGNSRVGAR